MTSTSPYPAREGRTRGPVLAIKGGITGLLYRCGHFSPGLPPSQPGAKVRAALDPVAPCPSCYPLGRAFHDRVFGSPEVAR